MVTQITLGNFGTVDGRTVLTGGTSKIDTQGLIDSLVKARRIPAVRLETRNETVDSQTKAFNDLRTLFANFKSAADTLRNPPGVANDSQNIFQYRTASLSTSTGAAASNFLDVSVQPGAVAQSYTVDSITQLARQTKQQSGNFLLADSSTASAVVSSGSSTPGLFRAGTINLRAVDGSAGGVALTLNEGDSLEIVAAKFNEISSRTGIQASVLTVSPGTYKLIYTATRTGTTYGFDLSQTAPAANAGIASDPSGVFSNLSPFITTQTAQNSQFSIDGISISRETNSVADALSGVTFTLKQPTTLEAIAIEIEPDIELVANAITNFADAYNEFRLFVSNQSQLDENSQPLETSVLYNNQTFRNITSEIAIEVSRVVAGIASGNPAQLSQIGLELEDFAGDAENPATKNILVVDEDQLQSSLLSNFSGVRSLFEHQQISNNSAFLTTKRSNNLAITNFQVVIDRDSGTYKAIYSDPVIGSGEVELIATELPAAPAALSTSSGFNAADYVTVELAAGAPAQNYVINSITQLATETVQRSSDFLLASSTSDPAVTASGSPVAGLLQEGTINLRSVSGTPGGVALTLVAGDALSTVASKFNALTSQTGIRAEVISSSPGVFNLEFTATQTGQTYAFDLGQTAPAASAGVESDPAGVFSQLGAFATTSVGQNAIFSVDGSSFSRESNAITDAINGATVTLKQAAPPGSINVGIQRGGLSLKSAPGSFVVQRTGELSLPDSNSAAAVTANGSPIAGLFRAGTVNLRSVSGNPGGVALTLNAGDSLNTVVNKFNAITSETGIRASLVTAGSGIFRIDFASTQTEANFVFDFNAPAGAIGAAIQSDPSGVFSELEDFATLPPAKGDTIFDGYEFLFASGNNATIDVTFTQGFGDRFFNLIDRYTNSLTGTLTTELEILNDNKTRNEEEITRLDETLDRYRERLVQQYASLEAALSRANNILQLLDAQANARNSA